MCCTPLRWSPRCASHRRDKLHTAEMKSKSSLVSGGFWRDNQEKSLKGWTHLSIIMKEKIWSINFLVYLENVLMSAVCSTPRIPLCDLITLQNRNWIRKYFSLFIRGPDGFESWKNRGRKSRGTLPLKSKLGKSALTLGKKAPAPGGFDFATLHLTFRIWKLHKPGTRYFTGNFYDILNIY